MIKKLSSLLSGLLLMAWVIFFRPVFLGGPASYIIVSGISMEPTLSTGDLLVMRKFAHYQVGDVIVYRVGTNNIIHRIIDGSAAEGFVTRGDNKTENDPWKPKPEDILGKQWLYFPSAGEKIGNLLTPQGIAAMAGLAALVLLDDAAPSRGKFRRGKRMKNKTTAASIPTQFSRQSLVTGLRVLQPQRQTTILMLPVMLTLLVIGLFSLALAIFSYLQPSTKQETVHRVPYEHNAVFRYTVYAQPSLLSTVTEIGPVGPETDLAEGLPPIITEQTQSIEIDLNYVLTGISQSELQGQVRTVLRLEIGEEWKQSFPLGEPVLFNGPGVNTRITLSMDQLRGWIQAIEEQLGYRPSAFTATITPIIQFSGTIDGRPASDEYTPAFKMTFHNTLVQMESELSRKEAKIDEVVEEQVNSINLLGLSLSVPDLQQASLLGTMFFLLPSSVLALLLYFWLREDELTKIRIRYGGMLIAVEKTDLSAYRQIQVATMKDLARLAQPFGSVIFHMSLKAGTHLFFIPDGQILYTYFVQDGVRKA